MTREPRQSYPYALKLRAIGMVLDEGRDYNFVCAALDIPKPCLSQWVAAHKAGRLKPKRKAKPVERTHTQARAVEGVMAKWLELYRS
jgi:transposase-like protein